MKLSEETYWSVIINLILKEYFFHITTCLVWPHDETFDLFINTDNIFISIWPKTLETAFAQDIFNHTHIEEQHNLNGVYYDKWVKKLLAAIQHTHCEGFVVFQDDIPTFLQAFQQASLYSIWRSTRNYFLFPVSGVNNLQEYFQNPLITTQPNILILYTDSLNSSTFSLKTNKFVGSLLQQPQQLYDIATFNASTQTHQPLDKLYDERKLKNLQGREIVVGVLDYAPVVVIDEHKSPQYYDHAENNPRHRIHVDGTEMRILLTFCEIYNCSIQVDTSIKLEWGSIYNNYSGYGLLGLLSENKVEVALAAMYHWYIDYKALDLSFFLGRSGITCLVPAPLRLKSWFLPLKPFQLMLWLGVIFCLCVEMLSLFLVHYCEDHFLNHHNSWLNSWLFSFTITLKLFVSQSANYVVKSYSLRILLFACYVIDIIITSIYGGGLSSILTLPTLTEAADTVERLSESNILWTANSFAWVESIMANNNSIYKRLISNFRVLTNEEMLHYAKTKNNMAFAVERMTYGHFGSSDYMTDDATLQHFKLMLEDLYFEYTTAMVARLWPFLTQYNYLILAWHSAGLAKYWEWKITADYLNVSLQNQMKASMYSGSGSHGGGGGPMKLDMNNFAGILLWWLLGMLISLLVFFGELLWHRYQ